MLADVLQAAVKAGTTFVALVFGIRPDRRSLDEKASEQAAA